MSIIAVLDPIYICLNMFWWWLECWLQFSAMCCLILPDVTGVTAEWHSTVLETLTLWVFLFMNCYRSLHSWVPGASGWCFCHLVVVLYKYKRNKLLKLKFFWNLSAYRLDSFLNMHLSMNDLLLNHFAVNLRCTYLKKYFVHSKFFFCICCVCDCFVCDDFANSSDVFRPHKLCLLSCRSAVF